MKRKIGILLLTVTAAAAMAAGLAACTSADGASAYDLAVANGFSGTEAEWLETLNGSNGTNGTNGVGIDSVALNKYNDMVVTYTDETSETLKYHGTIANPYVIYSGIYEAAYSDTYGYVSFLEEGYITVDAGETVYITYIVEDASNIYIGVDGGDEDEISLGVVENYVTDDASYYYNYTWTTADTLVYTSLSVDDSGSYTFAVINSGDEEITLQTAVGEYTLTFMLDKTVGTTLTSDNNYASATFTATTSGWYEFTLTGDGKANVYVIGGDDDGYYGVYINSYRADNIGEYSYVTYVPAGVTFYLTCAMLDYDVASSTFAVSVAETTIDTTLAISSEGFTTEALEGSDDYYDNSKIYTYYVTESGYYKITASAATEGAAALVNIFDNYSWNDNDLTPDTTATITVNDEETTIASLYWRWTPDASCYMFFTVGSLIDVTVYYDAIVTFEALNDGTLTSEGLTLTGLENPDEDYSGAIYVVYVEDAGTYTFTYTDKTEEESDEGVTIQAYGDGEDQIYYSSETIYGGDGSTFTLTAGTYIVIYVYSDAELAIAVAATDAE